ncbi:hypothetical protein AHAS_Ahas02G0142100 [Arachis hypogaea]
MSDTFFSSSSSSKPIRKTVRTTNKKEYVRGLSEKKMVVMNEGLNSPSKDNGSPKHGMVAVTMLLFAFWDIRCRFDN